MEYAILGRTGLKVSRLGFGCMRLPMKSNDEVDRDKTIPMLRRAVELGVNYFDTAVGYCGSDSQRVLGEAMEDIRDQVILSTKNHHYDKQDVAGWWKNMEDSIEFLRTDCIDIYNVHGLNYEGYEGSFAGEDGLYKELMKAKEQGLIRYICHSFHGTCESLKKMVDTGLFDVVTCQYNLLDRHLEEGVAYAAEHNEGVVIMGPVGGGRLGYPSEKAAELVGEVKSTPELALRFVLSNENVTVALSGMSDMKMLEENVETVSRAAKITQEDHEQIEAAIQERKQFLGLYCTGCGYCMPCPEGVDIPANFEILNLERIFGLTDHAKGRYASLSGKAAL
ncbi:MAG: aldo/keto reductase, partial [Candidatus Brocadiae bacterium]|nr:aldo/keto reductase [Candidatus Brocadiia bacterium]